MSGIPEGPAGGQLEDATPASVGERWPRWAGLVGLTVLVAFGAYAVATAGRQRNGGYGSVAVVATGSDAPDFDLPRLGGGADVHLASFRGEPTVVSFYATWCPGCAADVTTLDGVAASKDTSVHFVGVDEDESDRALMRRLLAGARYPVALDVTGSVASQAYRITSLPVTYYLDATGKVAGESFGAQTTAGIEARIAALLSPALPG